MNIKTRFEEFDITIKDAVFHVKEVDIKNIMGASMVFGESSFTKGKVELNAEKIVNEVIVRAVLSWKGVNNEDGTPIDCTDANKGLLPIEVKTEIFGQISNRVVLTDTEKKS